MGSNLLPLPQGSLENVEDNQSCSFHVRNQNRRNLEKQKCLTKYHSFYSIPFHSISFSLLTPSPLSLLPSKSFDLLSLYIPNSNTYHLMMRAAVVSCSFSLSLSLSLLGVSSYFVLKKE
jgi:hypothetical protein